MRDAQATGPRNEIDIFTTRKRELFDLRLERKAWAEQRSSAYWRIGFYSPCRACDSVIRTCFAFSFWYRCSDWRSHLFGSRGERRYVDSPRRESRAI
jgi:hypothetical protein